MAGPLPNETTKRAPKPAPDFGEGFPVARLEFNRPTGVALPGKIDAKIVEGGEKVGVPWTYEITYYPRIRSFRIVCTPRAAESGVKVRMIPESWAIWEPGTNA